MILEESGCMDCGLPCKGKICPNYIVKRYICDDCGEEKKIYEYFGEELCISCIEKRLVDIN